MGKKLSLWFILILIIILSIPTYLIWKGLTRSETKTEVATTIDHEGQGIPDLGGPFTLTDHTGQKRSDRDFRGKLMMVYFGYRYCPDICPTALTTITEALEMLGSKANHIQPLFITVDPKRDTIEDLAEYVEHFHPSLIALTGSEEEIQNIKKAYRVFAQKVDEDKSPSDYLIDHSSIIYVMDRQGHLIAHFNHATPPEHIVQALRKIL